MCFSDAVRAPIPQTNEVLVEETPQYGKFSCMAGIKFELPGMCSFP